MTCDKCLTKDALFEKYAYREGNELKKISLCHICDTAYKVNLLPEFMKEDFGIFPISDITKNMIRARKLRASGNDPWSKLNGEDKGELDNNQDPERLNETEPKG